MDAQHDPPRTNHLGTAPSLRITTTRVPGATIVRLHGQVDQDERHRLERALTQALTRRPPRLVVDLSDLDFCDSTGLNALLKTRLAAQAAGVELLLGGLSPQVRRLLEITETNEIFTIHDSVRALLADAPDPTR
ncbi:anti-sigma B factor antagonist [Streptomyces sp. TLI_235]|nr:STAS domain-containing protein [Streptomyces sp. TLI_235]PBC69886.1 anti-sigma B factor antagonist [Streptomyces sp. TLI_235]